MVRLAPCCSAALRAKNKNLCREMTQRNGKLPLFKYDNGETYEGEWLNGNRHGRGIFTWPDGER